MLCDSKLLKRNREVLYIYEASKLYFETNITKKSTLIRLL